jgi:hypothetical protein
MALLSISVTLTGHSIQAHIQYQFLEVIYKDMKNLVFSVLKALTVMLDCRTGCPQLVGVQWQAADVDQ